MVHSTLHYIGTTLYLFCLQVQYNMNGGKCGVCGDPWQGPRHNENGGKYANGIIVRKYEPGKVISVVVDLTANHKGWFEFRLCPNDDNPRKPVTKECLDQFRLLQAKNNKFQYTVPHENGRSLIKIGLRLPANVRCRNCVLQWKYNAGNSWGVDPGTGRGCLGCGNQEQFYGCADIAIGYDDVMIPPHNTLPADVDEDKEDSNTLPPPIPHIPHWTHGTERPETDEPPEVNEAMEHFMEKVKEIGKDDSFKFLPIMQTDGVHPCMCICKTSPVHLHGGSGNIEVKLFEEDDDKQVCMCMCQNSAKSLNHSTILHMLMFLLLTVLYLGFK